VPFLPDQATSHKLEGMLDHLCEEYPQIEAARIGSLLTDSVERLADGSTVLDFLPLLAYRLTRERLVAIMRAASDERPAEWYVSYISLSGGGRSQIAAALTSHLSEGRVSVHCMGTAIQGVVDTGVRTVISEIGVDPDEAFARPVTDEVLRASDVVVTMGHSVGVVEIPPHARHEDWRVGDPLGAPLAEVRRVRADIERRVMGLLNELGVPEQLTAA